MLGGAGGGRNNAESPTDMNHTAHRLVPDWQQRGRRLLDVFLLEAIVVGFGPPCWVSGLLGRPRVARAGFIRYADGWLHAT